MKKQEVRAVIPLFLLLEYQILRLFSFVFLLNFLFPLQNML